MVDLRMTKRESYSSSLYSIEEFSVQGTCERQEDATGCLIEGNTAVMVVCDGIGGMEHGELAAEIAVKTILECAKNNEWKENPAEFLKLLVVEANNAVFGACDENGSTFDSGCTLVVAVTVGRRLYLANVGDSRAYLITRDKISQLTRDHNYKSQLDTQLANHEITREYYEEESVRGAALTSYLGMGRLRECYITEEPILLDRDEVVLIESDGLYKLVSEEESFQIVRRKVRILEEAGNELLTCAGQNRKSYQDNTSIILFRIK